MEGILRIVISAIALVIAELVPQHDDLEFLEVLRAGTQRCTLEHAAEHQVRRTTRTQTSSSRSAGPAHDPGSTDPPPNPRTELTHPTGLSPASRSRPALELVAGGGRLDQPPDQPAAAKRERWEHVRAAIAPHPGLGRGLVVRLLLRKTPYPSRHPNPPGVRLPSCGRRMSRSPWNAATAVPL